MAYQVTHKALKASIFHFIVGHWTAMGLAEGHVSFKDVIDEMNMLHMEDIVREQYIVVVGAYNAAVSFSRDMMEGA